jgi:hypothetical protein
MVPWTNSWFQLSAFVAIFSLGLMLFVCSHGASSSSNGSAPAYSAPPSTPPPSQPAYTPPEPAPPVNPPTPSPAYNPAPANGPGPIVEQPGVFSFQAPPSWQEVSGRSKYNAAVGVPKAGFTPNISVFIEQNPKALGDYAAMCVEAAKKFPTLQNVQVYSQEWFTTSSGLEGIRVQIGAVCRGLSVNERLYFIDGGAGKKVLISAACLANDAAYNAPFFDATARSFKLE